MKTRTRPPAFPLAATIAVLTAGLVLALPGWARLSPISIADFGVTWTDQRVEADVLRAASLAHFQTVIAVVAVIAALASALGVVTLLLGRAIGRRREMAVRAALGAHGRLLVLPLLREGAARFLVGGLVGALAGAVGALAAQATWPGVEPEPVPGTALAMGAVIAVAVLLLALPLLALPARAAAGALPPLLATGERATDDRFEGWGRRFLAGAQLTVTLSLLAGGLVVLRTDRIDAAPERAMADAKVVVFPLAADMLPPEAAGPRDWARVMREIAALPGVDPRAISSPGAFVGLGTSDFALTDCGNCSDGLGIALPLVGAQPRMHSVTAGFFDTAGLALLEGRGFTSADAPGAEPVVILSRSFASRFYFEDGHALGHIVRVGGSFDRWYRVIGVVEDTEVPAAGRSDRPLPALYLSALQHPPDRAELAVRLADGADPAAVLRLAAAAGFAAAGPPRTLAEVRDAEAAPLRWWGRMIAALALLATALSVAAVHAVARQDGEAKRREVAVRRAVGAPTRAIVRAVAAGTLRTWAIATVLAVPGAILVSGAFQQNAAGVPAFDARLYAGLALALLVTMLAGAGRPALEAARVDPLEALKS